MNRREARHSAGRPEPPAAGREASGAGWRTPTGCRPPLPGASDPETPGPAMLLVQARTRAAREATEGGHVLGEWTPGTVYPGGEQDWWAACHRCGCLVWVVSRRDGLATVQHVPDPCRPEAPRTEPRSGRSRGAGARPSSAA